MNNLYIELFKDSFLAALVAPLQEEFILPAMLAFPEYDTATITALALAGGLTGLLINYVLGVFLVRFAYASPSFDKTLRIRHEKVSAAFNKYFIAVVLFSWAPLLGGWLLFLAGMFRSPLNIIIPLTVAGKMAYYLLYLI